MEKDFIWFKNHYAELQKEYGNAFVVIKNETVLGVFDSYVKAVRTTMLTEDLGTFIVQECNKDCEAYQCSIASMNFI